ncbi:MAG: dCMP deaminase family protein [Chitinophagaceae bacterium]|nr:dCMP deaminase family protein [Chitinophagaceae bacterium]
MKKRQDYISWDEYFMGVALLSAKRSKDPSTQVGACIVNDKNKIVGAGYNGLPIGCSDDEFPWSKQGDFLDTKYPFVCHAELNAILNNIGMDLKGCKIYTALFPCNECTKAIIQSGITEVVFLSDKYQSTDSAKASRLMLDMAGVRYRKVEAGIDNLVLSFNERDV